MGNGGAFFRDMLAPEALAAAPQSLSDKVLQ
jgi:hypothetical protein